MPESELLTIGAFARSCGLSASALRFYADAGVLVPAVVDAETGYRYYAPGQTATAQLIRRLRAADMPLPAVAAVLAEPDPARAAALLDTHLADLDRHLDGLRAAACAARGALGSVPVGEVRSAEIAASAAMPGQRLSAARDALRAGPVAAIRSVEVADTADEAGQPSSARRGAVDAARLGGPAVAGGAASAVTEAGDRGIDDRSDTGAVVRISGPALAAALDQVATATVPDPELPVLNSIHLESAAPDLILTATDRYRLAIRTLRPARPSTTAWTAVIDADELRACTPWLRRSFLVDLRPIATGLEIAPVTTPPTGDAAPDTGIRPSGDGEPRPIDTPTGRVGAVDGMARVRSCRRSAERFPDVRAMLAVIPPAVTRVVVPRAAVLDALEHSGAPTVALHADPVGELRTVAAGDARLIPATVTGPPMALHFAVTTLYPAVATAIGPDLMIDLVAPDQPTRLRSADDGDLLTLAMPCRPEPTATSGP
ncbi:DNA polymerase III subunit beta family protein [Nocardia rhizosphaerae]|uniref:MerR family transcriptional regulator n=1 Tax=Nocardia rhizosphaerae TaxID=1691571 RepID=A0ABV8LEC1_9NOCA